MSPLLLAVAQLLAAGVVVAAVAVTGLAMATVLAPRPGRRRTGDRP